ncbi:MULTISPECIES: dUTP diphosphatase [unclassified Fusibacter]|uniref:dUTP diphosphatase n=1 Tax=unclassified Fusibacter TaxID=2624464 RepID=UPI00101126E7|nr:MULTISPECIES: dUTP diphosphatase [unclassified Fusibacter]MCK8058811.1 dUTP diphosphatase [Fusibacter sp. A2]NPE21885.1 dUTP diphosphatase [Fusibacter sp. A1]RXV61457.1 dUTP diphosphatase [Fusibacter sp. A1]
MKKIRVVNHSKFDLPQYETVGSAGMDLKANIDEPIIIKPFERMLVPTGLFMEIPIGYEGQVRARSGLSIKKGITLINAVGTIDSDYRGEVKVPLVNLSQDEFVLNPGERIAQLVITEYTRAEWESVESLEDTARGAGGFGSTGS